MNSVRQWLTETLIIPQAYLRKVLAEGTGAGRVMDSFLSLARKPEHHRQNLDLNRLIDANPHARLVYEPSELGGAAFVGELPLISFYPDVGPDNLSLEADFPVPISTDSNSRRAHILVLDDEVSLAEMLAEFLGLSGYQTEVCSSAVLALSLVKEKHFDLVISDFRMPAMNGEKFFKLLTAQNPEMASRVIFVTGDTVGVEADLFFKNNSVLCLTKPYSLAAIQEIVADRLDNRRCSRTNVNSYAPEMLAR